MSNFERVLHIDPLREKQTEIENRTIELSDEEHLIKVTGRISVQPDADIIYKPQVIDLRKKNAKIKSKSPTRKVKKIPSKSNKTAVAGVQAEL